MNSQAMVEWIRSDPIVLERMSRPALVQLVEYLIERDRCSDEIIRAQAETIRLERALQEHKL